MRGGTHFIAGVVCGAALAANVTTLDSAALLMIAGALGALAPDLDHPQGALSRRVGLVAAPIRLFVRHRGATHSLGALLLAMTAALILPVNLRAYGMAAALGYASHILLDMLTVQGVPLLWPKRGRVSVLGLTTGGLVESAILYLLMCALLWIGFSQLPSLGF